MSRTPLFRKLMQTMRQARWLNENPDQRAFFFEAREASQVSRRDFVRMLGAAGFVTAARGFIPLPARAQTAGPRRASGRDPVAILGAGLAGLTAAYRLHQAGIPCAIFEASERTGGRVLTKYDFNKDSMFCELGGELVDTNHRDLIARTEELDLAIQELKGGDKGTDLYFFGDKHHSDEQLIPLFEPFARRLASGLEGIYDKEGNFTPKARKLDKLSLAHYLSEAGNGVEKWVIDLLRVVYTIQYGCDAEEQSALTLIVYLKPDTGAGFKIFGDSDESKRIKGGSSSLSNALVKAVEGKVEIHQGHSLANIRQSGPGLTLTFACDGRSREFRFTQVICALPFTMLRLVDSVKDLALSKKKQEAIARLGYGDNSKVMYGFTERWWRNPTVRLPAPSNGSIYTDLPFQCTWESSRSQPSECGILTEFLGGPVAVKQLSQEHFDEFREELGQVFAGISNKFDGKRALMNWPGYKFTRGSYSCPLVGQYTTLLRAVPHPELNGRLIFAGEHTSGEFAGFMNGAVESGNRATKEILGLRKSELRKAA